jgi:hypothetical protein
MTYVRQLIALLFVGVAALAACGDDTSTTFPVPPAAPFRPISDCETDELKALPQVPDMEIPVCERGENAGELSP